MKLIISSIFAFALSLSSISFANSSGTKVALVPGGPHPYFAAWEQAGLDAVKDFGLGKEDYRVPEAGDLSKQNELIL